MEITREQVLAFRVHAQELDIESTGRDDAAMLDLGVQDTGPDGAPGRWRCAVLVHRPADQFTAWTLRGAPHVYRRSQAAAVARAVSPWSEADAAKRVFDASRPLKQAGITVLDALDRIAEEMRDVAATPVVKGEMSTELHRRLPAPYQRWCRVCEAEHLYEQPFRLAALRGGLELQPGTSPPVLERITGWRGPAKRLDPALDPVRAVLRLLGPATPKQVAEYVDAPVKDVKARWPDDVVPVMVEGEERSILEADLAGPAVSPPTSRESRPCSARSTCSSSPATGRRSCPRRRTARTSGAPSAVPAECWSATRSSGPGGHAPRARSCASP